MAQGLTTTSGTLIVPNVYSSITVQTAQGGLATSGVMVLLGEADSGPDYTLESSLQDNAYGPGQFAAVQSKYGSGRIVDAFLTASQASADPNITGSPSRIIIVKTNVSAKATANLLNPNASVYSPVTAQIGGKLGNLLYVTNTISTAETLPTTGAFTFIIPAGTANLGLSVNGVTTSVAVTANMAPSAFVTAVNGAAAGVTATGGAVNQYVTVSGTLALAASGAVATITRSVAWNVTPAVGDTLTISSTSAIIGAASANVGTYLVTASTSTTVTATKLSNGASGASATPGTVTNPVAVSATAILSTTADLQGYGQVTIANNSATIVQGYGKSLEFAELATGTDLISRYIYANGLIVTWVSKAAGAQLLSSATEQIATTTVNRSSDNTQETWTVGGQIGLKVSYAGTSATLTLTQLQASTTVAGGTGANQTFVFNQGGHIATIADLANYLNSQTGYSCTVGTTSIGQLAATALDNGTFNINSNFNAQNGRIKTDAYRYAQAVLNNSLTVAVPQATAGLPAAMSATYLAGGTKGGTTDAIVAAALLALQNVQCNFVVPMISQDATLDIAAGLTDAASTYTVLATHAAVRSHVLLMSTLKRKHNRQGFLSFRGTFAAAKNAAANMASNRVSMNFQDVKALSSAGGIVQFQPWMAAVAAAGMQAAGFYRPLVNKLINITGCLQAAGDYSDQDITNTEDALTSGLLPIVRAVTGGYKWVSDQTTYGKDMNFSLNSIQSTYVTDIIALSAAQQMNDAFIGQSLADVSPGILLSYFSGIMADFLRLKLLSPSAGAPSGFVNASVTISGTAFILNAQIYPAGALYYGLLNFLVSPVQNNG